MSNYKYSNHSQSIHVNMVVQDLLKQYILNANYGVNIKVFVTLKYSSYNNMPFHNN